QRVSRLGRHAHQPRVRHNASRQCAALNAGDGAWYYPAAGGSADQWTTLGESIAIALDFERPADEFAGSIPLMAELGRHDGDAAPIRRQLRNGKLVLDDYVPFVDIDTTGMAGIFTPNSADVATGLGIPIALGLVDRFTMLDDDDVSQTRPVQGLININTAPYMVLRQLPMFAPTPVLDATRFATTLPDEWWWPGTGATQHDFNADIAAGVIAYRDRTSATVWQPAFDPGNSSDLNFRPTDPAFDPSVGTARGFTSGVAGLRDGEGFRSVGELLMVREFDGFPEAGAPPGADFRFS
ncbi:MAG: hypothetical protein AAFY58_09270, partial [Planctomycetota bacterium]